MTEHVRGLFREETFPLPRGRIVAVLTPDGAAVRVELFESGLVAIRRMRDFEQARRCARDIQTFARGQR